jgi:hypothetical protein
MSVFTNPASSSREEATAYTSAILELLGDKKPLDVLGRTEGAIRESIAGLSMQQLRKREAPKKWSIAHVVQHLADSEIVLGWRLRMVLSHNRPALAAYDQDLWADNLGYDDAVAEEALTQFGATRQGNLRLFNRASPDDLRRVGLHSERGEESVARMIRLYAGHDLLHLNQIQRIKETF